MKIYIQVEKRQSYTDTQKNLSNNKEKIFRRILRSEQWRYSSPLTWDDDEHCCCCQHLHWKEERTGEREKEEEEGEEEEEKGKKTSHLTLHFLVFIAFSLSLPSLDFSSPSILHDGECASARARSCASNYRRRLWRSERRLYAVLSGIDDDDSSGRANVCAQLYIWLN